MFMKVCNKCHKVLIKGQWVHEIVPIEKCQMTVCPSCAADNDSSTGPRMVYQEYNPKRKNRG